MNESARHRVPPDHPMLAGHFPGEPIVPGAYLLAWVMGEAERALAASGTARRVAGVARVKFVRPLRPGEEFRCIWRANESALRFEVATDDATVASGVLDLESSR